MYIVIYRFKVIYTPLQAFTKSSNLEHKLYVFILVIIVIQFSQFVHNFIFNQTISIN